MNQKPSKDTFQQPSTGAISLPLGADSSAPALGLVYSSTSDTRTPQISVDPRAARLSRLRRGVITGARLHTEQASAGGFRYTAAMLTLTYRDEAEWQPYHVAELMKHIRQWGKRRGFPMRYVWVMELTKAGRPHYHAIFWLPKGVMLPKPDKQGWWSHGMTRIERARNAIGYAAKYASKGVDSAARFPGGARIHACGGLSKALANERAWWLSPAWVRKRWDVPAYQPRQCKGGGWISLATGEWCESPYLVKFTGAGGLVITVKGELTL